MLMSTKRDIGFYRVYPGSMYCYIILSGNVVLEPHPTLGYITYSAISMGFIRGVLV